MTNYKGRDFILKNGTWSGGTTVADCRTNTLRINHEMVDITNKSSAGYRTILEGAGTKSVTLTLSGNVTNDSGFETLQGYCNAGSINAHAMGWGDGDTLEGSFMASSFEVTGEHNGAQTFSITLESSGTWTFTAA
jgi:TP901-1 family phage major tail protein